MKFCFYCSDIELSLLYDAKYDYSDGVICRIDCKTHLAVSIKTLVTKQSISYAVFDWSEKEYNDMETNIQAAEALSPDIIRFANSTIESSYNEVLPLPKKKKIQSALTYHRTNPIGIFKSSQNGIKISMVETGTEQESTWTISVNNKIFTTLNNKQASEVVFRVLCDSIYQYVRAWFLSF